MRPHLRPAATPRPRQQQRERETEKERERENREREREREREVEFSRWSKNTAAMLAHLQRIACRSSFRITPLDRGLNGAPNSGMLSATGVLVAPPLLERQSPQHKQTLRARAVPGERDMRQREQTLRARSLPGERDKRAATVLRRRSRIAEVQTWELDRCACSAPWRVLPIFKSFDPRYCEHVHRCYECLKPAKNQMPAADELHGKRRHRWMDTDEFTKKAVKCQKES